VTETRLNREQKEGGKRRRKEREREVMKVHKGKEEGKDSRRKNSSVRRKSSREFVEGD
jgi:hypothetical protein